VNRFLAALRFLTILPVPGRRGTNESAMVGSVLFFPVIGLLVGVVASGLAVALVHVFSPQLLAAVLVLWLIAVSGGFHLDGLADTADGFLSARPREQVLEIMKDSHIGVMGVIAVVAVLGLKVTAVASLPAGALWRAVLLIPLAGRCSMVFDMGILPGARKTGGLGSLFLRERSWLESLWAVTVLAGVGWLVAGYAGLLAAAVALGTPLLFALLCYRRIGGATGDTLGAACEITEAAVAVALSARPLIDLVG